MYKERKLSTATTVKFSYSHEWENIPTFFLSCTKQQTWQVSKTKEISKISNESFWNISRMWNIKKNHARHPNKKQQEHTHTFHFKTFVCYFFCSLFIHHIYVTITNGMLYKPSISHGWNAIIKFIGRVSKEFFLSHAQFNKSCHLLTWTWWQINMFNRPWTECSNGVKESEK